MKCETHLFFKLVCLDIINWLLYLDRRVSIVITYQLHSTKQNASVHCWYSAIDDSKYYKIKWWQNKYDLFGSNTSWQIPKNTSIIQLPLHIMDWYKMWGFCIDKCVDMSEYVTLICHAGYYHLKNIRCLKQILTQDAHVTVVHVSVTYCFNYCTSVLYDMSKYNINRLQRIKNTAVHIVTNTRKYHHITRILQNIHRLSVRQFIHLKMLHTTYIFINGIAPENLCKLLPIRKSSRSSGHPFRYCYKYLCRDSCNMTMVFQLDTITGIYIVVHVIWRLSSSHIILQVFMSWLV